MPKKIRYVSHDGREFAFEMAGDYKLRGTTGKDYSWDVSTMGGQVAGFSRKPAAIEMDVVVSGTGSMRSRDDFYEAADSDVMAKEPGRIYDGDFYREGYFIGSEKSEWFDDYRGALKLTFMPNGKWWVREMTYQLDADNPADGLDHPYDFEYDLASSVSAKSVRNDGFWPAPVRIVVQGPADAPAVSIAGNMYAVDVDLADDQYLSIDGAEKTVSLVSADGAVENVLHKRLGLQVENSGEYVFQPIPTGDIPVTWNGGHRVAVTVIEQRSEPRWY